MATAVEQTFYRAVIVAEGIKQVAKQAAFTTFQTAGFTPAAYTTYLAALATADDAFYTSVNAANSGPFGYTTPNAGTPNAGTVEPGNIGFGAAISPCYDLGGGLSTMGAIG